MFNDNSCAKLWVKKFEICFLNEGVSFSLVVGDVMDSDGTHNSADGMVREFFSFHPSSYHLSGIIYSVIFFFK